ncbi:MAG TPA: M14 family metallopeptidase [Blastocatellia bacterium]|nr:M14 family metallopeptidase [Blastocatellia bacterium]
MFRIKGVVMIVVGCLLSSGQASVKQEPANLPRSRAEISGFTETSRYQDVIEFLKEMSRQSDLVRLTSFGKSFEGRDLPLVIVSEPPVTSPEQARASGKMVVFIMANIHAGEVDGKEATLHLLRDLTVGRLRPLLARLVVLLAPIYNADGNDRIGPNNRRHQNGPSGGVGTRENAQGLDLNRDFMKLETPEANALVQNIFNRWDPHLTIDCHTTNGSYHGYALTYAPPLNPNGHREPIEYVRERMLPEITKVLDSRFGYKTYFYGNFIDPNDPSKGWQTFDHRPRFGNNYLGLRNRMTILAESYAYADFRTRVDVTEKFLQVILEYAATHSQEMMEIIARADRETVNRGKSPTASDQLGVRFKMRPFDKPVPILGYEIVQETDPATGQRRPRRTDRLVTYVTQNFGLFEATRTITIPRGYLLLPNLPDVVKKLRAHGVLVEEVKKPLRAEVEVYAVESVTHAAQPFQNHRETTLAGKFQTRAVDIPAGSYYISLAQPKANLAFYLLEPESDDGLVDWNFFDDYLMAQQQREQPVVFPVYRVHRPLRLVTERVESFDAIQREKEKK